MTGVLVVTGVFLMAVVTAMSVMIGGTSVGVVSAVTFMRRIGASGRELRMFRIAGLGRSRRVVAIRDYSPDRVSIMITPVVMRMPRTRHHIVDVGNLVCARVVRFTFAAMLVRGCAVWSMRPLGFIQDHLSGTVSPRPSHTQTSN